MPCHRQKKKKKKSFVEARPGELSCLRTLRKADGVEPP